MQRFGQSDSHSRSQSRRETNCRHMDWWRWPPSMTHSRPSALIPPVQKIPDCGRAQSSPLLWEGRTALDYRLRVSDRTSLVWTDPFTHIMLTLLSSQVLPKTWLTLTSYHHSPFITYSGWNYTTSVCIFNSIKTNFPHSKTNNVECMP